MRWLLVPLLSLLAACARTEACGPDTCLGCCDSIGECSLGSSPSSCGLGGASCLVCEGVMVCAQHRCALEVDAGTPDAGEGCQCPRGCCRADGTCASGTTPSACGSPGSSCVSCSADERCERGLCVGAACGGCLDTSAQCRGGAEDFACGADGGLCLACLPDERCTGGACVKASCTSVNCADGCCTAASQCVSPPTVAQCGLGGRACATCSLATTCRAGVCR